MKVLSCGVIITDGNIFLVGRVTGKKFWGIPKGRIEESETEIDAALRELKEETNIELNPIDLIDLGRFHYIPKKDLHLFLYKTKNLPKIENMFCSTFFENKKGEKLPEFDKFKYISFLEMPKFVNKSLVPILNEIKLNYV